MTPGELLNSLFSIAGYIFGGLFLGICVFLIIPYIVLTFFNLSFVDEPGWSLITIGATYLVLAIVAAIVLFYSGTLAVWWGSGWAVPK